jgi:Kef-type K+ transport system membrane component KefB
VRCRLEAVLTVTSGILLKRLPGIRSPRLPQLDLNSHPFLTVMAIALVASLLSEIRFGTLRVPVVVWEMVFGILIGPYALGIVRPGGFIQWFGQGAGLAALFFMAGMELDLQKVKGRPLSLAIRGWILSLGLGLAAAAVLHSVPGIQAPMMVGLVLTTTALGTFMPILRDTGNLDSRFGRFVLATGAAGEFAPVMVVSLVLTRKFGAWQEIALMLAFVAVAVGAALIALGLRPPRVLKLLERTMHSSTQLPVCLSLLLVASLPQAWSSVWQAAASRAKCFAIRWKRSVSVSSYPSSSWQAG